jgi:hypothetical protein
LSEKRKQEEKRRKAFTYPEMIFLLVVVALFLGGTIWVASGAFVKSHPFRTSEGAGRQGETAMNKIEAMVKSARQFSVDPQSSRMTARRISSRDMDFLADLDSDGNTGTYSAGSAKGLERVQVVREGTALVVIVRASPTSAPRSMVLTRDLAPGDPNAYSVEYFLDPEASPATMTTSRVHLSITSGTHGSRLVVSRDVAPPAHTPVKAAPGP